MSRVCTLGSNPIGLISAIHVMLMDLALVLSNLRQETMLYQQTCVPVTVTISSALKYFDLKQ